MNLANRFFDNMTLVIESKSAIILLGIITEILGLVIIGFAITRFVNRARNIVIPYNIAVIGLPRSGKTTLITSMFQMIFYNRFLSRRVVPRGTETIDRINRDAETIRMGRSLGPTAEQDIFAYRADLTKNRFGVFKNTYQISIGDFAGEYSLKMAEVSGDDKSNQWLHQTSFFKWIMEADAYIFVFDIAAYKRDGEEYLARIEGDFRSAWQHLARLQQCLRKREASAIGYATDFRC